MRKLRTLNVVLVFILVFALIPFGAFANAEGFSPFKDVGNKHWGLQYILKMQLRGVVTGYGDGRFQPDKTVSQLEAVVMAVRAMGLEDEAKTANTTQIDNLGLSLPKGWNAIGYVAVAAQKGLIEADLFNPNQGASRAWVAQLIIRMIGAENEVGSTATTSFVDDSSIPSYLKGYVALASEKGIITGSYNANSQLQFNPNSTVTRAQLATMIGRTDRFMADVDGQLPVGTIQSITNNIYTIKTEDGVTGTYIFSSKAALYNPDGSSIQLADLKQGDQIRFGVDSQGYIVYLEQLDEVMPVNQTQITGTIVQHLVADQLLTIKDENGKLNVYRYDQNTKVKSSSTVSVDISSLAVGNEVILYLDMENKILTIELTSNLNLSNNKGTIYSLDLENKIIMIEDNGKYRAFSLSDQVIVEYAGVRFPTVKDLQKGDQVELVVENDQVTTIRMIQPYQNVTLNGKVVVVSTSDQILTLRLTDGSLKAYEISEQADIQIEGINNATLADLKVDDEVSFTVENQRLVSLTVLNRFYLSDLTGTVKSIDTVNRYLTIENSKGELKTYPIDDYVDLDLDLRYPEIEDIEVGMKVSLKLKDNLIYAITLNNTVEGEFVRIDDQEDFITLKNEQRQTLTYRLDPDVDVNIANETRPDLSDLEVGQEIIVTIKQEVVTKIDVRTAGTYTLTDISTSRKRITVDIDGDEDYYYLSSSTTLSIPNVSKPTIEDLKEGDTVQLTFIGDDLERIDVIPPTYGTIASIETYREQLILNTSDGQKTISLNNSVTVYNSNGTEMSINNLKTDDYVKVVEVGSEILITQMEKVSGTLTTVNVNDGRIYIQDTSGMYKSYQLAKDVRVWKGTATYHLGDLQQGQSLTLYLLDDVVIGIKVN
ncbi:S-layer homology domain-containing protein [Tepidibacillus infernus]|uniref:SLH domain-containing protein n=1 Tax=Tepidibacillus decaturensis TaxID=1413211 RepID=A0A135L6J3_9BACI|nr:S-layer homology domain-containing protein [Tepidibacillus decaturensis]KXG44549.1 hypothetical protein U473_11365 [Tepidibacillus decaturensis]